MKRVFAIEKFKGLLLAGSFTVLANYIIRLSDSLIGGNMLGSEALAGINLAGPCLSLISFFSGLVSTGMATHYSLEMGRCNRARARQFFMQGVWSVLIFGLTVAALVFFGARAFVGFFGASQSAAEYAVDYLRWVSPIAVLEGVVMLLVALGYADGDTKVCATGYAVMFGANFLFSIVFVKLGMGTAGCGFGSVLAEMLGALVLSAHFLRKCNTFKPVCHFSVRDSVRIVSASFGDAAAFLCDCVLFFFLNKFAVLCFGASVLPMVGAVTVIWGFLEMFNGATVAVQPLVSVYYGEGNTRVVRRVMNAAILFSVIEGLIAIPILWIFADKIAICMGMVDAELIRQTAIAIRMISFGAVALTVAGLFNSYYMFVERPGLASVVTVICYLFMPIAMVALGALWGFQTMWLGLGVGTIAGIAFASIVIITIGGIRKFPLALPEGRDERLFVFDLMLEDRQIVEVSRRIGAIPGVPMRAALMAEEVFMAVKERAHGRLLMGEATIDLNDGIRMTLRDDGEIFDITDADAKISSLRSFLVASMMQAHSGRMNLVTVGFNRNVFEF